MKKVFLFLIFALSAYGEQSNVNIAGGAVTRRVHQCPDLIAHVDVLVGQGSASLVAVSEIPTVLPLWNVSTGFAMIMVQSTHDLLYARRHDPVFAYLHEVLALPMDKSPLLLILGDKCASYQGSDACFANRLFPQNFQVTPSRAFQGGPTKGFSRLKAFPLLVVGYVRHQKSQLDWPKFRGEFLVAAAQVAAFEFLADWVDRLDGLPAGSAGQALFQKNWVERMPDGTFRIYRPFFRALTLGWMLHVAQVIGAPAMEERLQKAWNAVNADSQAAFFATLQIRRPDEIVPRALEWTRAMLPPR